MVSRFEPRVGLDRETIAKALQVPVAALLPNDFTGLQQCLLEGELAPPHSPFGKAVAALARGFAEVSLPAAPVPSGGSLHKILHHLLQKAHA